MLIKNGEYYKNNYARAAAYFLGTCAEAPAGDERLAAYRLITGIYSVIAEDAESIGYKPVPDVSFALWEKQQGRDKDIKSIRGAISKIEELVLNLFKVTESAELSDGNVLLSEGAVIGRTLKKALGAVGVTADAYNGRSRLQAAAGTFEGLKELAAISRERMVHIAVGSKEDKPYLLFSRCVFEPDGSWLAVAFDRLLGAEGRLINVCNGLEKRGYKRIDCLDGKEISLDYVKQHGKKNEPVKQAWGERTHTGISLTYEELRLEPCFLWIRMPMFKIVLEHIDKLPEEIKKFIAAHTKTCDGCRYCVQTDKTHMRPLACVKVDGMSKCPFYPGYSMNWRELPEGLDEGLLKLIDALDELFDSL